MTSGKRLPKWAPNMRRGVYLGSSPAHLANVPLILMIKMGYITPQYHLVFDDCFSMVEYGGNDDGNVELWQKLFSYANRIFYYLNEEDDFLKLPFLRGRKLRRRAHTLCTSIGAVLFEHC